MKVLIVEDDEFKLNQLGKFVEEELANAAVTMRQSYQSGLKAVVENKPTVVLLDMSLPNYDISSTEAGYCTMFFAGRDILQEITRLQLDCDVIVVTQFEQFGEGPEVTTLKELKQQLSMKFSRNYIDTVYYHPAQEDWKTRLRQLLGKYIEELNQ